MERVVVDRSFTLYKTFYEGGVATDPDAPPTVVMTRSDGTVVTTGAVVNETPDGTWSVTVAASENSLLDSLTATWTADVSGEDQVYVDFVEVAGRLVFTIAEARALKPLDNTTNYPEAKIVEMRTTVEDAIEAEYGCALVPRYSLETHTINAAGACRLRKVPRVIRSLSIDGTAVTGDSLTNIKFDDQGFLSAYGNGYAGWVTVVVGYEHGLDSPPPRIKMGALRLLRTWLVSGPTDDRASTFSSADGGTFGLVVPGRGGSIFGLPELDAAINSSPYRVGVI